MLRLFGIYIFLYVFKYVFKYVYYRDGTDTGVLQGVNPEDTREPEAGAAGKR